MVELCEPGPRLHQYGPGRVPTHRFCKIDFCAGCGRGVSSPVRSGHGTKIPTLLEIVRCAILGALLTPSRLHKPGTVTRTERGLST